MESNIKSATGAAAVGLAAAEAKQANGDFGIVMAEDGRILRRATKVDHDRYSAECARRFEPECYCDLGDGFPSQVIESEVT